MWHLITRSESREEFYANVEEHDPYTMVIWADKLKAWCDKKWPTPREQYESPHQNFVVPDAIQGWLATEFTRKYPERPK
jgi:hypothetical protein